MPAILIGRGVRWAARLRKLGGGSAVPGLIVNRIAPGYLGKALNGFPHGLVIVSGSSGKSTTTKMLVAILRAHGLDVFTNPSTANISQGLTSALLEQADLRGRVRGDIAVLEMDEGHGALIAPQLDPNTVLLMNVMVDQIDRFHDSEMVAAMLARIAERADTNLVLNADDDHVNQLVSAGAPGVRVSSFGVSADVLARHPRGLGYERMAERRMDPDHGFVVTDDEGARATIRFDGEDLSVRLPARGVHYAVDAAAALASASAILEDRFEASVAIGAFDTLDTVFGRGERRVVRGQEVEFVLVQNPASFQLNVDSVDPETEQILFAIGSDVRDPSYLWPADASRLSRVAIASGSQAEEIALQLAYDGVVVDRVEPDLGRALDDFLASVPPRRGVKTIIFSADSMRRTRSHLALSEER